MKLVLDPQKRYTYADYMTWWDDQRRELMDGFIRELPSGNSPKHQTICGKLGGELYSIIKKTKKQAEVFFVPLDVRMPKNGEKEDDQIYTVVQPDIFIVCDLDKLEERGCLGAPDFIAEIQSPASSKYDLTEKFNLYESVGVREYWVVFPLNAIQVFLLQPDGKYDEGTIYDEGKVPVHIFDRLEIDLKDIF